MSKDKKRKKPSIGGLVGESNGGLIIDSHFEGTIQTNMDSADVNIGGLVGSSKDTTIINSTSKAHIETNDKVNFEKLQKAILGLRVDEVKKNQMQQKVKEMEKTVGTSSFKKKYSEFMAIAADHLTVLAPFISLIKHYLN